MPLLEIESMTKKYGEKLALNNFSFNVDNGEIVALIGKNGAGKTTLMNSICSIIFPDNGKVFYKSTDLLENNSLLNEFGILIRAEFYDFLNTYENLKLLMIASDIKNKNEIKLKIKEVLKLVGLEKEIKKRVKGFSFGMKQRLGLAQTLLSKTDFLILDEPFIGLDPIGKEILKDIIINKARKENAGVLFSTHDLNDASEICDRVIVIENGNKVYDGVFDDERQYIITVDSLSSIDILNQIFSLYQNLITINDTEVSFKDKTYLNDVIKTLTDNDINIVDIDIKENSLYRFFIQEGNQ